VGFLGDACPLRRSEGDVFLLNFWDFRGIGSSESTRFPEGLVLGNSGKPVTLETSSLTKFLRYVFQGRERAIFGSLGPAKPQGREHAIFGNLGPAKLPGLEHAIFGSLGPAKPQGREHAGAWNLESVKSRIS
jgi:hypothetical protein